MERTQIANAVTGIFALSMSTAVENLSAVSSFDFGASARQDADTLISALWGKRMELIKLQYVADKPLYGQPEEGCMDTQDYGLPDEQALDRAAAIKAVSYEIAIIERHIQSLEKQLVADTEQVGKKTNDGARIRLEIKGRQYKPRLDTTEAFLITQKARATAGEQWLSKICLAQDTLELPHVSAQDATDYFNDLIDDEQIDKMSSKAWDSLIERFAQAGELVKKHDEFMAVFNAGTKDEQDYRKAEVATENREFKKDIKGHSWWIENVFLQPLELLHHSGTPAWLINSPEWRTQIAKIKAAKAQADAQAAMAATAEAEAMILQCNANMALFAARQMQIEMERRLAQQQLAMQALLAPPAPKVETPVVEAPAQDIVPKPAPKGRAPRSLVASGRGAAGFAPSGRA